MVRNPRREKVCSLSQNEHSICEKALREWNIQFRSDGHDLFLSYEAYETLKHMAEGYFDISPLLHGLTKAQRDKFTSSLAERGLLIESPLANLLRKKLADNKNKSLILKLLASMKSQKGYIKISTVMTKYHITKKQIEGAIAHGRLAQNEEFELLEEDIKNGIEEDRKYVALANLFDEICDSLSLELTNQVKAKLIKKVELASFWNAQVKSESDYLGIVSIADKFRYYIIPSEAFRKEIIGLIHRNAHMVGIQNFRFLWDNMTDFETKMLDQIIGAKAYETNYKLQPMLHKLMSILVAEPVDLQEWNDGHIELSLKYAKSISEDSYKDFRRFLNRVKDRNPCLNFDMKRIPYPSQSKSKQVNTQPYTIEQYLEFGKLIFHADSFWGDGIIDRAIENRESACALLKNALSFGSAWRNPDIAKLEFPSTFRDKVPELVEQIRNHVIDTDIFFDIWDYVQDLYVADICSSKNDEDIALFMSESLFVNMGVILTVCAYHRIQCDDDFLFRNDRIYYKTYHFLFGEAYDSIFGKSVVSTKRLEKDFLLIQAAGVYGKDYPIRSLSELLAAYIRGHRIYFNEGQKTIYNYIPNSTDGLSIDQIVLANFKVGTLGYYKDLAARCIISGYKDMGLKAKCEIIAALDISPRTTENQISALITLHKEICQLADGEIELDSIMECIGRAVRYREQNANDPCVTCLYQSVYGEKNPKCRMARSCITVNDSDEAELCKWGIYSAEYIYVLRAKKKIIIQNYAIKEQLANEGFVTRQIALNEKLRHQAALNYLDTLIDKFMREIKKNKGLEDRIYALLEESS